MQFLFDLRDTGSTETGKIAELAFSISGEFIGSSDALLSNDTLQRCRQTETRKGYRCPRGC